MPNPSPKTEHLKATQAKPLGDRPLGKVIGTRYPVDVEKVLLEQDGYQAFIREAVEEKLKAEGLLNED